MKAPPPLDVIKSSGIKTI